MSIFHVALRMSRIKGGSSSRRRGDVDAKKWRARPHFPGIAPESIRGRSTCAAGIKFEMARWMLRVGVFCF